MNVKRIVAAAMVLLAFSGCKTSPKHLPAPKAPPQIASPAGPDAGEPNLFVDAKGRYYLSWIEKKAPQGHVLKFSIFTDNQWSPPQTIASGENWFVNWADFPSLTVLKDGTLATHWLAKSAEATFAYDVQIAFSQDGGKTWSQPVTPHRDGTPTEHGFVSLLPWQEHQLLAVWLDGRKYAASDGHDGAVQPANEMSLRAAVLQPDGEIVHEWLLDPRVCDCCQTGAALLPDGVLVGYRNRSPEEIRDIGLVKLQNGRVSQPKILFADQWKIPGCPVNGPAMAAQGQTVAVAWFTEAQNTPQVKMAFSQDGGDHFDAPVRVDDGQPMGRVDLVLLQNGEALVSWLENTPSGAEIRIRRIQQNGVSSASTTVARSSASRASGFPRMAQNGHSLMLAWTEPGEPPRVKVAIGPLP